MITSKSVIAKVIADLGLDENKIKISDIKEWIGEAVSKIGAIHQKNHQVKIIKFKGFQCKLPCDLNEIDLVAYSSTGKEFKPIKKAAGAFSVYDKEVTDTKITQENGGAILQEQPNNIEHKFTLKAENLNTIQVQYDVKPGYLMFNIEEGYVKLSYFGEYTDEDGMPMIPDIPSYHEAIYWYVAMKLLFIEYFTGRKPQYIYYDAKRSWNFYRQQAYAEAMLPNSNEIENIKNTWHTLVPETDEFETFFNNTGDEQLIYNWN